MALISCSLPCKDISLFWQRCNRSDGIVWEVLSEEVPNGRALCIFRACDQRKVLASWIRRKGFNMSGVSLLEMGHWSQIQLDFVLAGFEKCGSSSLSHNMAKHPEVTFIPSISDDPRINSDQQLVQDGHFFWRVGGRLLPPLQLIQSFNQGHCCAGGARISGFSDAELVGQRASRGPAKRGERNPVYAFQRILMKMVSLVPGAKVILLVCDPVGWLHSAYADTLNWYAGEEGDPPRPPLRDFALTDFVAAPKPTSLSKGWYNLSRRRAFFTFLAEGIVRIFGSERVHMLHRDSLDPSLSLESGIHESYNRLMAFLGLRPFEPTEVFDHKNKRVRKAKKSPVLCEEELVLKHLKRYFRPEYARLPTWIGRLGEKLMVERRRIQQKDDKTRQTKALKVRQPQKPEDRERGFQLHFAGANEDRLKEARRRQQQASQVPARGMESRRKEWLLKTVELHGKDGEVYRSSPHDHGRSEQALIWDQTGRLSGDDCMQLDCSGGSFAHICPRLADLADLNHSIDKLWHTISDERTLFHTGIPLKCLLANPSLKVSSGVIFTLVYRILQPEFSPRTGMQKQIDDAVA
eukprot:symbB.v1.2.014371.t1/scaffold956.1/size149065/4